VDALTLAVFEDTLLGLNRCSLSFFDLDKDVLHDWKCQFAALRLEWQFFHFLGHFCGLISCQRYNQSFDFRLHHVLLVQQTLERPLNFWLSF
jgi:hypothetical protein